MPGSVSERVQLAKQKEEAKKETRKQRKEKERLAQKQMAAIVLLQCAARRRAAMRIAAEQRGEQRTPDVILEERRAEWLAQRRSMLKPGYASSFVSAKLAEQERMRYPWVRNKALAPKPKSVLAQAPEDGGSSADAPSAARASFRELSRKHFTSLYMAADSAIECTSTTTSPSHHHLGGAAEEPAKPRSPKWGRSPGRRTPFTSIELELEQQTDDGENVAPQHEGGAAADGSTRTMGKNVSSPSVLKRLSNTVRRVSKEAMGMLSA